MTAPAIELTRASKRFGDKEVLKEVDMTVAPGTVFGFLGANGAGKTTTLRLLLGLLRADAGDVRVFGLRPSVEGDRVRRSVGALLENDGHYDRLTAAQNLRFYAGVLDLPRATWGAKIEGLLRAMGLWEHRAERVAVFSKGMRQKLAVARALLGEPRLLLLDEPFTGLDPAAAVDLRDRLRALASGERVTILLTTHDLHHVEKICDAAMVLERGAVKAAGALAELRRPTGEGEELWVHAEGLDDATLDAMVQAGVLLSHRRLSPERVVVRCTEPMRRRIAAEMVERGVVLLELTAHRATLEETFLQIVSSPEPAR
jgi:ABC-2 type transport system ATP-binding protein